MAYYGFSLLHFLFQCPKLIHYRHKHVTPKGLQICVYWQWKQSINFRLSLATISNSITVISGEQ